MIWRQLLRLLLRAVSGLLWVGAGLIVKQARRVEQLAQALLNAPEPPAAGDSPPAHWLEAARSPGPPQHWVDRVRRGAPHLLVPAPDAAERRAVPPLRGAGTAPSAKRAAQPSRETGAGNAAEPPMRMRIHVLDDGGAPRSAAPDAVQTTGSTAGDQPPASRQEMSDSETTAGDHARSAAAETSQYLLREPRRTSASPAAGRGAEESTPPLSSRRARFAGPQGARIVQQEPSTSHVPAAHDAAEESPFLQPLGPPASRAALEDTQSAGAETADAAPLGPDAARRRRRLRGPQGAAAPPEFAAPAETGSSPDTGAALPAAKRPAAPQARWAEAPGATETGDHAAPPEEEEHWPSLPSPEMDTSPPTEAVLRIWKHRRRLDDEQRGAAWNG